MNKGKIRIFEGFAGYGGGSFGLKRLKENLPGLEIEVVGYSEFDKFASELFDANHHKADGSPLLTQKDTIATVTNTGAKVGEASANATEAGTAGAAAAAEAGKSVASVPYAGPALAAAAILMVMGLIAGVIASAKTFATGGIIQGSSSIGDYNLARVNSGEMILNGTQQKRMFNLLDGNTTTGNNTVGTPQVEFKIKGTELIGCINNVSKKRSKI